MVGEAVEESSGQPFSAEHLGPLDEGLRLEVTRTDPRS